MRLTTHPTAIIGQVSSARYENADEVTAEMSPATLSCLIHSTATIASPPRKPMTGSVLADQAMSRSLSLVAAARARNHVVKSASRANDFTTRARDRPRTPSVSDPALLDALEAAMDRASGDQHEQSYQR